MHEGTRTNEWRAFLSSCKITAPTKPAGKDTKTRPRIVVLGTGWGAHAFLSSIDAVKYEVVVVSPRESSRVAIARQIDTNAHE